MVMVRRSNRHVRQPGRTSTVAVWAAGDVADPRTQLITSVGAGSAPIDINADVVHDDIERVMQSNAFVHVPAALASDDRAFLIARRDDIDVGVISIESGLGAPLYVPDGAVYIAATAVVRDARGSGVGAALVEASFAWARDHGHRAACMHFATANATSTSFWAGIGFTL